MRRFLPKLNQITAASIILGILVIPPQRAYGLHIIEKRASVAALADPGLIVIDESDRKVILENKPDSPRVPASVLKILTATVALQYLQPDKNYSTSIWSTEDKSEFLIRGSLDPFLTSTRAVAEKFGHRYLPALFVKANQENLKKVTIFYEGLFPKDVNALSIALKNRGIKNTFTKVSSERADELAKVEIASLTSPPLSKIISHTMLWSDNLIADRLAREATRSAGITADSAGLTATYKSVLSGLGVNSDGLVVKDGSGLSKKNRLSARTLVELLVEIRKDPKFDSIYEGLPIAGETGTLVKRFQNNPEVIGLVHAKTGWVNHSVTLAGYAKSGDKEYAFAILADKLTPTLKYRNRAREAMDRLLEVLVKGDH